MRKNILKIALLILIATGLVGCSTKSTDNQENHNSTNMIVDDTTNLTDKHNIKEDNTNNNSDDNLIQDEQTSVEDKDSTIEDKGTQVEDEDSTIEDKETLTAEDDINLENEEDIVKTDLPSSFDEFIEQYGENHIINVQGQQYYVDNALLITILDNEYTYYWAKIDLGEYGELLEEPLETGEYLLKLNENKSFQDISMLESKLNEDDKILASIVNLFDTSSWYGEIPIN